MNIPNYVALDPDEDPGSLGGGPTPLSGGPSFSLRTNGFISLIFGFALGLTGMIFYGLSQIPLFAFLQSMISQMNLNLWTSFLFGFISGTLLSVIYNVLVFRHHNLFGLNQ